MNITDGAQTSDLPAKIIRYYEEIGLIRPARVAPTVTAKIALRICTSWRFW